MCFNCIEMLFNVVFQFPFAILGDHSAQKERRLGCSERNLGPFDNNEILPGQRPGPHSASPPWPHPTSCLSYDTGSSARAWLSKAQRTASWATPGHSYHQDKWVTAKVGHFPGGGAEGLENIWASNVPHTSLRRSPRTEGKGAEKQSCPPNIRADDSGRHVLTGHLPEMVRGCGPFVRPRRQGHRISGDQKRESWKNHHPKLLFPVTSHKTAGQRRQPQ